MVYYAWKVDDFMCEAEKLQIIIRELTDECKILFGERLCDVRLFGSYARGDNDDESDIDVMILLDMDKMEVKKHLDSICELASNLDLRHDVFLSPLLQSKLEYDSLKKISGFFKNVEQEGVSLYA